MKKAYESIRSRKRRRVVRDRASLRSLSVCHLTGVVGGCQPDDEEEENAAVVIDNGSG